METPRVTVLGTGSYLPAKVSTNADLAAGLGIDPGWIAAKTGILERRVAAPDEATSDLATRAAQRALDAAGVAPEELDLLVVATSTPDEVMPATACRVQANLGAHRAPAFDVDAVCAGFLYGLATVDGMLRSDPERRLALLVGADTYSRILDYDDRRTSVLFGDGAGAVVLGKTDRDGGILATILRADGDLADLVRIPAGGTSSAQGGLVQVGELEQVADGGGLAPGREVPEQAVGQRRQGIVVEGTAVVDGPGQRPAVQQLQATPEDGEHVARYAVGVVGGEPGDDAGDVLGRQGVVAAACAQRAEGALAH
jgi:3-oxoacyl-[acyl-carrier-protein] synthase III